MPIKYDDPSSCNKCGGKTSITIKESIESTMCEANTKCLECGFSDYWAYGFFESGAEIESKCKKYEY